jgi:hypothetical protein
MTRTRWARHRHVQARLEIRSSQTFADRADPQPSRRMPETGQRGAVHHLEALTVVLKRRADVCFGRSNSPIDPSQRHTEPDPTAITAKEVPDESPVPMDAANERERVVDDKHDLVVGRGNQFRDLRHLARWACSGTHLI